LKADLHVHTNISDSSFSISETLRLAKEANLSYIGITDHDTIAGLKEAQETGRKHGIGVIPGIEISAYHFLKRKKVHILGFCFDQEAFNIKKLCSPLLIERTKNTLRKVQILQNHGYDITKEEVIEKGKDSHALYKQHLMAVLVDKGYCSEIYSNLYYELFGSTGICSGDIKYADAIEAVRAVKEDGGIAVLAHPGQLQLYDIALELVLYGLDGIELYHKDHTENDEKTILEISKKHNLLMTGGSDFHGQYSESKIRIGEISAPRETIEFLINYNKHR